MRNIYHPSANLKRQNTEKWCKLHIKAGIVIALCMLLLLTNRLLSPLKCIYYDMQRGMNIIDVINLFPKWTISNSKMQRLNNLWILDVSNESLFTRIGLVTYEHICCYFDETLKLEGAKYIPESGSYKELRRERASPSSWCRPLERCRK